MESTLFSRGTLVEQTIRNHALPRSMFIVIANESVSCTENRSGQQNSSIRAQGASMSAQGLCKSRPVKRVQAMHRTGTLVGLKYQLC